MTSLCGNIFCLYHREKYQKCEKDDNNFSSGHNEAIYKPQFFQWTEMSSTCNVIRDCNRNEIHAEEISVMDDTSYDLSEGDLCNLFKLEMSSST